MCKYISFKEIKVGAEKRKRGAAKKEEEGECEEGDKGDLDENREAQDTKEEVVAASAITEATIMHASDSPNLYSPDQNKGPAAPTMKQKLGKEGKGRGSNKEKKNELSAQESVLLSPATAESPSIAIATEDDDRGNEIPN
jgi:hypothetical protein